MFGPKTIKNVMSTFQKTVDDLNEIVATNDKIVERANADIIGIKDVKFAAEAEANEAKAIASKISELITA